ncbi:MAG: phosphatase domain-containing protein [Corynebacterium sp.]|nr:phosphatase domain-containing protein [Corynebacterium sp.]
MALSDIMRKAESSLNSFTLKRSQRGGWQPLIVGYTGYGTTEQVRVFGRVLMHDPDEGKRDTWGKRGYQQFLTIQVEHHDVSVTIGEKTVTGTTDRNGYIDLLVHDHGLEHGWHTATIEAANANAVEAQLLIVDPAAKIGIVSDIDDTVLVTWLPRALTAAWNSWAKRPSKRQAVPGMAEFYAQLQQRFPQAPVFYLSTGAWNTFGSLKKFLSHHGFPAGPMLLTDWGPTETGLFRSGQEHKRVQLRNLLIAYPDMQWILIGDDGQHDPLTYGDVANEHPDRIHSVLIRNLSPQEQLLSHGSLSPLAAANEEGDFSIPLIQGANGNAIAAAFNAAHPKD